MRFTPFVCSRAFFWLVFLAITTLSSAATVPVLTVLSPSYAISSGQNGNSYRGDSPTHIVAYATSPDCTSGISAIQIYTADGVLAYSTASSYIDVQLALSPNFYQIDIKAWDNCGGVANDVIQDYVQSGSGQVTVAEPIANFPYAPQIGSGTPPNISVIASATTTCPKGVSAMGVYDAPHHKVAGQSGNQLNAGVTLSPGTTNLVVEEWDNCGGAATTTIPVTVANDGFPGQSLYTYIPDASTGTLQMFWAPTNSCALNPSLGNPAPAHYDPISVVFNFPYIFVLNQDTADISVYYQDQFVEGDLTQVPGSPFSLKEPAGYTPTGFAVPNDGSILYVFVTNKSTSGSGAGSIGEYSYNLNTGEFSEAQGSPLILKGNVQPTAIYAEGQGFAGPLLFTANGSSISVLNGSQTPTLIESDGSPFPVPGRYGASAGVEDIGFDGYLYTANSEGTISGFSINNDYQLIQLPGSPFVNPDNPSGTTGNPASIAGGLSPDADLYTLNAGAEDVGVFSVDQSTGALTYVRSEQKRLVKVTSQDRIRIFESYPLLCLMTSNGYAMSVNSTTGVTTMEPGSPFLGPGVYRDITAGAY